MSELEPASLPETHVIISAFQHDLNSHLSKLPPYIDVVPHFGVSTDDVDELARNLASPLLSNQFEITGREAKAPNKRGVMAQRLGGSMLHHLHDEVIGVLDDMQIEHSGKAWNEGEDKTWYRGTWRVSDRPTLVTKAMLVQKKLGIDGWRLVREYSMSQPNVHFGPDLLTDRYRYVMGIKK